MMARMWSARALAALLSVCLAAGPWIPVAWSQESEQQRLEAAKAQYMDSEYSAAATALRALLQDAKDPKVRQEANLYLGISELQGGNEDAAMAAFKEVLKLDANYQLDAVSFPPNVRQAFERARGPQDEVLTKSVQEPQGVLSPAEKAPKAFRSKVRWWMIALGGAAVAGVALAVGLGSASDTEVAVRDVRLAVSSGVTPCTNPAGAFVEGSLSVTSTWTGGTGDATVNYTVTDVGSTPAPPRTLTASNVAGKTNQFTITGLNVGATGTTRGYTIVAQVVAKTMDTSPLLSVTVVRACRP